MSSLMNMYNDLSAEEQEKLGKTSSRIKTPGVHLVTIVEAAEIDGNRIKVEFKTEAGETIDWTGFTTTKDENGNSIPNTRTLNQLTYICNAVGLKIGNVLNQTKEVTMSFKKGDVTAVLFTALEKKKLYVTTTTVLEGDDKNPKTCYVKQQVNPFKFFDIKKRNGLEIASKAPEGTTLEATDAEAKSEIEIGYKWQGNEACERKFIELTEKHKAASSTAGQITTNSAAADEDPDDI